MHGFLGLKLFAQCIAAWGYTRNEMCAAVPAGLQALATSPAQHMVGWKACTLPT